MTLGKGDVQSLLDALPGAVAVVDRDGIVRAANGGWQSFARACRGQAGMEIGAKWASSWDDDPEASTGIRDVLRGSRADFEHTSPCVATGRKRWVTMTVKAFGHDRAVVTLRDTTQLKGLELRFEEQDQVLQMVARGAPLGDVLTSITSLVEEQLPDTICTMMLVEGGGTRLRFAAGPSLPPDFAAATKVVPIGPNVGSCGTAAWRGEAVVVTDIASDPLWADYKDLALTFGLRACWSYPIRGRTGELVGTFAIYRHTEGAPTVEALEVVQRAIHLGATAIEHELGWRALQVSEENFRLLVNGVADYALFMCAPDGAIKTWNAGAERLFGYPERELAKKDLSALFSEDEAYAERVLAAALADGRLEFDARGARKDGTTFRAAVLFTPVADEGGGPRGFAVLVHDLTERSSLEAQLRHAQKMEAVGQLAGGIAHDFNNILTIIGGATSFVAGAEMKDPELSLALEDIDTAVQRATSLTRQLLAFSRRQIVDPVVLDVSSMLTESSSMLRRLINEDVILDLDLGEEIPRVRADRGLLEQIVMNLVVNARDAMPEGGHIHIRTRSLDLEHSLDTETGTLQPGSYAVVEVADDGVGMTEEIRRNIFQPFFSTKGPDKGTGLGLAVVYGAVKQSGGGITVSSEPGRGTLFSVLLPGCSSPLSSEQVARGGVRTPAKGETILLVEDEPAIGRLTQRMLESEGYEVIVAHDGREAISLAAGRHIDLLLTDVVMPYLGGPALAQALKRERPDLAVLYMTGYTDDSVLRSGVAHGRDHILTKPFTRAELEEGLREALDGLRRAS
ncbi:MAG: response regulator [Deltaproteobacteria bacterium]|nr:response regulator [Deltaproteobacteria bacterium]